MEPEVRAVDPADLEAFSQHRTICRPAGGAGGERQLAFVCIQDGRPRAYTRAHAESASDWTLGLYTTGTCNPSALSRLLEVTVGAVRDQGGHVMRTAIELDASDALRLFRALGLPVRSLLLLGGEAAVEFDLRPRVAEHVVAGGSDS